MIVKLLDIAIWTVALLVPSLAPIFIGVHIGLLVLNFTLAAWRSE